MESNGSRRGITSALILDAEQKHSEDWRPVTEPSDLQTSFRVTRQPLMLTNYTTTPSDVLTCVFDGLTAHVVGEMDIVREILDSWYDARRRLFCGSNR